MSRKESGKVVFKSHGTLHSRLMQVNNTRPESKKKAVVCTTYIGETWRNLQKDSLSTSQQCDEERATMAPQSMHEPRAQSGLGSSSSPGTGAQVLQEESAGGHPQSEEWQNYEPGVWPQPGLHLGAVREPVVM